MTALIGFRGNLLVLQCLAMERVSNLESILYQLFHILIKLQIIIMLVEPQLEDIGCHHSLPKFVKSFSACMGGE